MNHKSLLYGTFAFLGLSVSGKADGEPTASGKPNVLLFMVDQMQWNAMGCAGNTEIRTPNLDRLAENGIVFNRMYCSAYPSSPSRGVLMTGLYPEFNGVANNDMIMPAYVPTVGTVFKENGYRTAWFGKMHLGGNPEGKKALHVSWENGEHKAELIENWNGRPADDFPQLGFDYWIGTVGPYKQYLKDSGVWESIPDAEKKVKGGHNIAPAGDKDIKCAAGYSLVPEEHHIEAYFASKAVEYIRDNARDGRPFCMGVSFEGPHPPYNPPKPWDDMYSPDDISLPESLNDPLEGSRAFYKKDKKYVRERMTDEQIRANRAIYYGFVSYIDKQVGRVLDELDRQGLTENTIILFVSDHGDLHGEHGYINKIFGSFEELVRVPFIISGPGIAAGKKTESLASMVDVFPTLTEICGIDGPDVVHGRSFSAVLKDPETKYKDEVILFMGGKNLMRITEQYKYMKWFAGKKPETYDLVNDPHELESLTDSGNPAVRKFIRESEKAISVFKESLVRPEWMNAN